MTSAKRINLFERLVERIGGFELLQLFLLSITLGCAGFNLSVVVSRLSSSFMLLLATFGVWTAWMMSRSRLRNWGYGLLGSLIGVLGLLLTVGGVGPPLLSLLFSFFNVLLQLIQNMPLDLSATSDSWQAVEASLAVLAARFADWIRGMTTQSPIIDPTVISIVWGMSFWLAVFWAMWWVRRCASVLPGLLPAVTLPGFNTFYTKSEVGVFWLAVTVACVLVLQASCNYGKSRQRWTSHHLDEVEIEPELIAAVVLLSCGMMIAGLSLPTIPFRQIADALEEALQQPSDQNFAKSLGLEQTPVPILPHTTTGLTPTENHSIGPGPVVDSDIVMLIRVDGFHPPPPNEYAAVIAQTSDHFYWRAQIFSEYNGGTWLANTSQIAEIPANQPYLPELVSSEDDLITQHITRIQAEEEYAFGDGELLSLDQPSTVAWNESGDISSILTFANSYTASSQIIAPSVVDLRAASEDYPPSIRPYLELPDDLPPRVIDLAIDITANRPTSYDKAAMLEAYLRQFPYSREVPAPPSNRDAVDFFLFDLKTGYCDYYASALVVMARAAGIPARLVMGYSEGSYDPSNGYFIVRSSNAHAWAELYFPGIGWVEFEPTPSQPLPYRPGQTERDIHFSDLPTPGQEVQLSLKLERTWMGRAILRLVAIAVLVFIILLLPLETWWLSSLPADKVLPNIFRRLYRLERPLGIPPDPSRTPSEFGAAFFDAVKKSAHEHQSALIAGLHTELTYLIGMYNLQLFSEHSLLETEKTKVILVWKEFRRHFKQVRLVNGPKRRLLHFIQPIKGRPVE